MKSCYGMQVRTKQLPFIFRGFAFAALTNVQSAAGGYDGGLDEGATETGVMQCPSRAGSWASVEFHNVARVYAKLGVRSSADLATLLARA